MARPDLKKMTEDAAKGAQEQIDGLKSQLEQLLKDRINPVLLDVADRADQAVASAKDIKDTQLTNAQARVRARPVASVLISALVGFVAGRMSK